MCHVNRDPPKSIYFVTPYCYRTYIKFSDIYSLLIHCLCTLSISYQNLLLLLLLFNNLYSISFEQLWILKQIKGIQVISPYRTIVGSQNMFFKGSNVNNFYEIFKKSINSIFEDFQK